MTGLDCALAKLYEPLWQVEHCPLRPVWFICAGLKAVKLLWQVSHWPDVGMCEIGFPRAATLLWQLEQRPATGGVAAP